MMRHALLAFCAAAMLTGVVSVAADPPKLGPEWTYDKETTSYKKTIPVKVTRSAGGNVQGYYLDLRHDKVLASDTDENMATEVRVNDTIKLEIRKNQKGEPSSVMVVIGKCVYHDLDRDGVWDSLHDNRGGANKNYIRHNGAWVEVCDAKGGLVGPGPEFSLDGKTEYTWDGTEWKSRSVER
jgi:hypothetical protein